MYRTLNLDKIIFTIERLEARIRDRFPGAGLGQVCSELLRVAQASKTRVTEIGNPNYYLRAISTALMGLGVFALVYVGTIIEYKRDTDNLFGVLEGIDSAFNILILMGAAAIFLWGLEARWRRQQALADLHELRSIIHVIDMHQLTKDPSANAFITSEPNEGRTSSSPQRPMSAHELTRYLDYCSEMLSLSAKVAALYAQGSGDAVVIATSSELGQVTTEMASKIWQKIELVDRLEARKPQKMPLPKA
jgi:hypothetical protein